MSKATESKLNSLHGAVADVLVSQLSQEMAVTNFNEEGELVETGDTVRSASPATLAAAIKFLKDNHITADIETNDNLNKLRETLANKQKHSRLGSAAMAARETMEH